MSLTTERTPTRDWSPSDVRTEPPTAARIAGGIGLFLLTAGVVSVIASQYGRGLFGEGLGYLFTLFGVIGLLIHAASDSDVEVRRLYGLFAVLLLLAAVVVGFYPGKPEGTTERAIGYYLAYAAALGLVSLLFFIPFARHETEEPYRTYTRHVMLGVGAILSLAAVFGGVFWPGFLVGPGVVLALLGVGFLTAFMSLVDTTSGLGYKAAVGLGIVGAVALAVALGRSIVPTVLYEGPSALKDALQSYDTWKVAGRIASILVGLVIMAMAFNRKAPLWLRAVCGVTGLAIAIVFILGSTTKLLTQTPAPFLVPYGLILGGIGLLYLAISLGVCSDHPFVVLTRRELASYFYSPIAYLLLIGMAGLAALSFGIFLFRIGVLGSPLAQSVPEPILVEYWAYDILGAFQVVFLVPALTMRLFSEERKTGTLEVLFTAQVNDSVVVLSKFAAAWTMYMICWLPAGLYLIALRAVGPPFDYRPLLSLYLALGACGAGFVAIGVFFSSLTRNQIIAAVLTFTAMIFLLLMVVARQLPFLPEGLQVALAKLDYLTLWRMALSGQLAVQSVVVHLSVAAFFLFLTMKVLEVRKWG